MTTEDGRDRKERRRRSEGEDNNGGEVEEKTVCLKGNEVMIIYNGDRTQIGSRVSCMKKFSYHIAHQCVLRTRWRPLLPEGPTT